MIGFLLLMAVGIVGFSLSRRYVLRRLRFVDAIRSPVAPLLAGLAAAIVTWPLAALPIITTAMSAVFGIGTGIGTASAAKALRRGQA